MAGLVRAREATEADAGRITAIYNQGIEDRVATFETELRTVETVRSWFSAPYPIVVVERNGDVIGWANASQYRPRACYAGICEFSVYVDRDARGLGAGKIALKALIDTVTRARYTKLVSRVFVENFASRRLLGSLGFREVGVYHRHGQLDGIWRDVVIVERLLDETDTLWTSLITGTRIQVVKQHWGNAREPLHYSAVVIETSHPGWIAVQAEWTSPDFEISGVQFEHRGNIVEYFSPTQRFNVFVVFRRDDSFGGIYSNVSEPARLELDQHGGLVLTWEDHLLDVVKSADGLVSTLDEDEFGASGIERSNPSLAAEIIAAKDELRAQIEDGKWDI